MSRLARSQLVAGLLFISPWMVGFAVFLAYPLISSAYYSFTDFSGFGAPQWVGIANYRGLLNDSLFWTSLYNTLYYTVLAIPIGLVVSMILAMAMNQRLREVAVYRAVFYLPSILPVFATAFIFVWFMNPQFGLLNYLLRLVGLPAPNWLTDPAWAKFAIVLLAQWGAGNAALIFLAGLREIPRELYEAAEIDGARFRHKFWKITAPMMTPLFLFDVIWGLSLGLQVFTQAYIMTGGGPGDSTLFYVLYLYRNAFQYSKMGYASAMAWILFILSLLSALAIFKTSAKWVYYGGETRQ